MFVIQKNEESFLPEGFACSDRVINPGDQDLTIKNVCGRVLIIFITAEIHGLDEDIGGEVSLRALDVLVEPVHRSIIPGVLRLPLMCQHQGLGDVAIINSPGNTLLVQPIIKGILIISVPVLKKAGRHDDATLGGAAMDEKPIEP